MVWYGILLQGLCLQDNFLKNDSVGRGGGQYYLYILYNLFKISLIVSLFANPSSNVDTLCKNIVQTLYRFVISINFERKSRAAHTYINIHTSAIIAHMSMHADLFYRQKVLTILECGKHDLKGQFKTRFCFFMPS